jgi:hypothetical protein
LHSLEEFEQLAPEESRTGEVLADEHQLMLNRLSFELTERQRCVPITNHLEKKLVLMYFYVSLEQRRKELAHEKEELLKLSRTKATTSDSVKAQIETLIKVCIYIRVVSVFYIDHHIRLPPMSRRRLINLYNHTRHGIQLLIEDAVVWGCLWI